MSQDFRKSLVIPAIIVSISIFSFFARPVFGERGEREGGGDDDGGGGSRTVTTYVTQYVTKQVSKVETVTPQEYQTDTDGDGLVDAIDPDPKRPQKDYFTDSDGDSVPDAFDRHPGEDDFTYSETNTDLNGNGIIDAYEGR
jgi:hypothetical protein